VLFAYEVMATLLRRSITVIVVTGFVLIWSPWALAQDESCLRRIVSVAVADRNWVPVPDLKPVDFRAGYRGKPVKILSVVPDNRPHRIVIVLDASGSLGPSPASGNWQLGRALASHLAESRLQNASLALLIFNDRIQEQIDFSQGSAAVVKRLREIGADPNYVKTRVRGRTALWDTIIVGLGLLQNPTSADAFYAITDGGENASRARPNEVRRLLAASGSRVFVSLLLGSPGNRSLTPEEQNGPDEMGAMALATGGSVFGPVTQTRFGLALVGSDSDQKLTASDALSHFYQTMLGGYRVEIELPSDVDKWREWKLALSKEKQQQFKNAQLGYTRDLAPCKELRK